MSHYVGPLTTHFPGPSLVDPEYRSRRVAATPPVPPPVRAIDLPGADDPVFPHGIVRRFGRGGDL